MPLYPAQFNGAAIAGNGTVSGNLAVTGNETVGGSLGVTGTTTLGTANVTTAAVSGALAVSGNALGEDTPARHGLVAWAYDPVIATTGLTLTGGTVYLSTVYVASSTNVTKLYWHVSTAASGVTAGQNFVGLYDSTGARLATINTDSVITGTGTMTTIIPSTAVTAGSFYWVAQVSNATTPYTTVRATGVTSVGTLVTVGQTATAYRFAINGTSQTSLPTSITPASNTLSTVGGPWVAIG
ncbi:hypothetical protein [Streptomyces sp. B1-3]|uniref:hypothetical protein n=1 Tax=Streptomyces sp. B1-3 TaxID=3141453 RepID=UPI003D2D5392